MMFVIGMCLFLAGMAPVYWLLGLPVVVVAVFMSTLADIQHEGRRVVANTVWRSLNIPQGDVVRTAPSFLEGISVMRLRRYVFPWGRIYFVTDWSKFGSLNPEEARMNEESKPRSSGRVLLETLVVAGSGFIFGFGIRSNTKGFRIETSGMQIAAVGFAGLLMMVFAVARKRRPALANVVLWIATAIIGSVRW
jgi:hypothetical protein